MKYILKQNGTIITESVNFNQIFTEYKIMLSCYNCDENVITIENENGITIETNNDTL